MTGFHLGVDYGTSHTVAVLSWPDGRSRPLVFDGSPLLPATVYADTDRLLAGADAMRAADADPGRAEPNPKRRIDHGEVLLGDASFPVAELMAATLRLVTAEAQRVAGAPMSEVTITHPADWGSARKAVLTDAAARAGIVPPRLLPEPVAAARFFTTQTQVAHGDCVVVYDLGAGTCDVTVMRRGDTGFEVLAVGGLDDIGGLDLDALVVTALGGAVSADHPEVWRTLTHHNDQPHHRRALWSQARQAKESLSRRPSSLVHLPILDRAFPVTREQFEAAARPLLDRTAELTTRVIARAGQSRQHIAGLFLVGGSSRVPLVATMLHRATGIAPTILEQPELVVAEGSVLTPPQATPAPAVPPQYQPAEPQPDLVDEFTSPPPPASPGTVAARVAAIGLPVVFLPTALVIPPLVAQAWSLSAYMNPLGGILSALALLSTLPLVFAGTASEASGRDILVDRTGISVATDSEEAHFAWDDIWNLFIVQGRVQVVLTAEASATVDPQQFRWLASEVGGNGALEICQLYRLLPSAHDFFGAVAEHSGGKFQLTAPNMV